MKGCNSFKIKSVQINHENEPLYVPYFRKGDLHPKAIFLKRLPGWPCSIVDSLSANKTIALFIPESDLMLLCAITVLDTTHIFSLGFLALLCYSEMISASACA